MSSQFSSRTLGSVLATVPAGGERGQVSLPCHSLSLGCQVAPFAGSRYPNHQIMQGPSKAMLLLPEGSASGNLRPPPDDVVEVTWAALLVNQVVS